jgi:hypothetical protein
MRGTMKVFGGVLLAVGLLGLGTAMAQTSTESYSGDIWHRSTLTGDWSVRVMIWLPRVSPSI